MNLFRMMRYIWRAQERGLFEIDLKCIQDPQKTCSVGCPLLKIKLYEPDQFVEFLCEKWIPRRIVASYRMNEIQELLRVAIEKEH